VGWTWPSVGALVVLSEAFTAGTRGLRGVTGFALDELSFGLIAEVTLPELLVVPAAACGLAVVTVVVAAPDREPD
jgi:hypothetical protein